MNAILTTIDDVVWGIPLIALILAVGVYFTLRLKGVQLRKLLLAVKQTFAQKRETTDGEVSSFGALCVALAATIGTGNIVGVATAIVAGGPGALFWMWVAAFFGAATNYAECLLAMKYRKVAKDGHVVGGPFFYIENGMGKNFRWLGKMFAFFGAGAGLFGIGTITQMNSIADAVKDFFDPKNQHTVLLFGREYSLSVIFTALILTICIAFVLIGGVKRISSVAQVIVPIMAFLYCGAVLIVLFTYRKQIPAAFCEIIESAFGLRAVSGGALGAMMLAMQKGVARGVFTNEAGLGSAPIAAAVVKTKEPVEQGLVSMLGPVIDTLVMCTLTGLAIILTGTWNIGLDGVEVTAKAFQRGLPFPEEWVSFFLMMSLVFFAFSSILGWNYYSEKCMEYLVGERSCLLKGFRFLYILAVCIGPFLTVSAVWMVADIFNGLMAFPNLIALIALRDVVVTETKMYFSKR